MALNDQERALTKKYEGALRDALMAISPDLGLTSRFMFGGVGYFVDGIILAVWTGKGLALKLPERAREDLLKEDGSARSDIFIAYVEVPPHFVDDPLLLEPWVNLSLSFIKRGKRKAR